MLFHRILWFFDIFWEIHSTSNMSLLRSRRKIFTLVWLGQYWSVKKEPSESQTIAEHRPVTFSCFLWSLMKKKAGTLTNVLEGLVLRRPKKRSSATNSMVLISFCQAFSLLGRRKRCWGRYLSSQCLWICINPTRWLCERFFCSPLYS